MRMNRRAAAIRQIVLGLSLLTAGCGKEAPLDSGVQVLEPVLAAQSDSTVEFSQITGMGVDSKGQVYAGDGLGEIVVLDARGRYRHRFGRMGGGPGEFQVVGTVHLGDEDTLFVYDGLALRATVYEPNSSRVAYTIRVPEQNIAFPLDVQPVRSGYLLAHYRRLNGDVPGSGQRRDDVIRILGKDGSLQRDSVLTIREPETVEVKTERGEGFFFPAFARQSFVRWDPEGQVYVLWSDSTKVTVYDPNSRRVRSFQAALNTRPFPLGDATIDSAAEQNASRGIPSRTLRDAFRSRWRTWPLVADMLVDDQSRVWIKPVTHDSIGEWFAFTARGERVASFRLPQTVTPRLIRGDRLYGVSRDSLDVESVVVYRLTPSSTRTPERP
jgi:hypothetical protein